MSGFGSLIRSGGTVEVMTRLGERCEQMGLAAWCFDGAGQQVGMPSHEGAFGQWLRAIPLVGRIKDAIRGLEEKADQSVVEIMPGVSVVLMAGVRGRRRDWVLAVLHLGGEAATALGDPRSDPGELRRDAGAYASRLGGDPSALLLQLAWMRDDLSGTIRDSVAIGEFSHQLAEMYEEIGLLYRVGRSMNRMTEPDRFVSSVCSELEEVLPFRWVGVRFFESQRVTSALSGRLIVAGDCDIPGGEFESLTLGVLDRLPANEWTLLSQDTDPLARAASSQVLAHPLLRGGSVVGGLMAGNKVGDDREISSFETQLLDAAAGFLGVFIENSALYGEQRALFLGTVEAMTASIDAKDRYTCGHSERVAYLAVELAKAVGLDEELLEKTRISGLLHDVGKIGVPEAVLCKPGRLEAEEFEQIKLHPSIGYRILRDIPFLDDILPGVLYHHERWDGRGYPEGISGEGIPLVARLLGVADAFDAMSSTRSYRAALPRERVLEEVLCNAGTQFDPTLARVFVGLDFAEYDRMVSRHHSRDARAA